MKKQRFKNGSKLAMKLDMVKTYDRVEWCFIERVILQLRYCEKWVEKIKIYVSNVNFSFLINGSINGKFTPDRKG